MHGIRDPHPEILGEDSRSRHLCRRVSSVHNVGRAEPAKIAPAIHEWSVLRSIDAVEKSAVTY